MSGRPLAIACRCQILTGSYKGATRSCECKSPKDCQLTIEQREHFKNHHLVKMCKDRNWKEWERNETSKS